MKVFLCEPIHHSAFSLLKDHFTIIDQYSKIQECDVIISRNLHLNEELLKQCSNLKLIAVHGTGYDDVDIDYAKTHNIHLIHTPGQNALSVAELNIGLMLSLSRKINKLDHDKKNNLIHDVAPVSYLGNEVSYKTAGFIGVGTIAKETINILKNGFHMSILGYSPSLTPEIAQSLSIGYCDHIDEIFKQSDYIFICCPLNNDTFHMIHKHHFSLMKKTAYLINTARGAIVNEDDLYEALKGNKIAGAGLDVMSDEPISLPHPLLTLDNVIYTSHMGASTDEALKRVGLCMVEGILDFSLHKKPKFLVF